MKQPSPRTDRAAVLVVAALVAGAAVQSGCPSDWPVDDDTWMADDDDSAAGDDDDSAAGDDDDSAAGDDDSV